MIQHDSTCIYSLHLKICKYKNEFACRQLRPPPRPQSPKWRHGKEPPAYVRDVGSIPESGRTPGVGQGNALQYSCLENPHRQRSLEGCSPWGRKRVRHDVVTQHACPSHLSSPVSRQLDTEEGLHKSRLHRMGKAPKALKRTRFDPCVCIYFIRAACMMRTAIFTWQTTVHRVAKSRTPLSE